MKLIHTQPESSSGPGDWFTGAVWIDSIVGGADTPARVQAAAVHFAPGARTAWHRHPNGQVVHVTEGIGRAQSRDGEIEEIRAGDTVVFEPGEWHWHGAAPGKLMVHIAMHEVDAGGQAAEWGAHVTDAEYAGG